MLVYSSGRILQSSSRLQSIARVADDASAVQSEAEGETDVNADVDAEPQPQPQPQRAAEGQHDDPRRYAGGQQEEGGVEDLDDEDLVALLASVCTCDHRNVTCNSSSSGSRKRRSVDEHGAYAALLGAAAGRMQDALAICSTCRLVTRACVSPIVPYLESKSKAAATAAASSTEGSGSSDHGSVGNAAPAGSSAMDEAAAAAAAAIPMWKMPPQCVWTTTTNPAVRNAWSHSTGQQAAHLHGVAWKDCRHFHNDGALAVRHRLSGFHSFRTTGKRDAPRISRCVSMCEFLGFLFWAAGGVLYR